MPIFLFKIFSLRRYDIHSCQCYLGLHLLFPHAHLYCCCLFHSDLQCSRKESEDAAHRAKDELLELQRPLVRITQLKAEIEQLDAKKQECTILDDFEGAQKHFTNRKLHEELLQQLEWLPMVQAHRQMEHRQHEAAETQVSGSILSIWPEVELEVEVQEVYASVRMYVRLCACMCALQ